MCLSGREAERENEGFCMGITDESRLLITCGGTGGHFYPGLALARRLMERGGQVLLLLSGVNSESQRSIAESFGVPVKVLPLMPSPGRSPVKWIRFLHGLIAGNIQAQKDIQHFEPQAVLGMGSFASLPVIWAAHRKHIPIYLHDGNARIGRANRFLSRYARFLGTAFPPVNRNAVQCPTEVVGMPLRPELLGISNLSKEEAIRLLNERYGSGLEPGRSTLLVFGGSQGAQKINEFLPVALRTFPPDCRMQVIHLTGVNKFEAVQEAYRHVAFPALLLPGCDRMELPYSAGDLVIARSGGSTLAELALFGKPSVLIPYPYAAEGHQLDNACVFSSAGAAILLEQANCSPERIAELISDCFERPEEWMVRGARALSLAKPDASDTIIERIFDCAGVCG